jgi:SAM-dependent methyltransferase
MVSTAPSRLVRTEVLLTTTTDYHDAYELRRRSSTMTAVAVDDLCRRISDMRATGGGDSRPLRILSLGCGDGDLDLPLVQALAVDGAVDYVGVDVNARSLERFHDRLSRGEGGPRTSALTITLRKCDLASLSDSDDFDVVLLAHVLYYVADPAELIRDVLGRFLRTDGRLLVVHSASDGIPAVMTEAGLDPFLTAEDVAAALGPDEPLSFELLETELDTTELLAASSSGRTLLGFLVERDLTTLGAADLDRLHTAIATRSVRRGDRTVMPELLGVIELRCDLARATTHPAASEGRDTVRDYQVLAERFDWPARLRSGSRGPDGRRAILDVGCGTGRWLRALEQAWPELRADREDRAYVAVDPADGAVDAAAEAARAILDPVARHGLPVQRFALERAGRYDLVWAIHSLYAVPLDELDAVIVALRTLLRPDGLAVVVHPDARSFYLRAGELAVGRRLFVSAEDVTAALGRAAIPHRITGFQYDECIPASEDRALRHYLWDESIGNSFTPAGGASTGQLPPQPTDAWWSDHRHGDEFRFPQHLQVITFRGA